jgi:CRP/FNR family cyclic AMP-dependent transcriptional regulator
VPLFSELDRRDLQAVASLFKMRQFAAGETITREGSGGASFYLIQSGEASVVVGGTQRPALRAGDHFGEVAVIDGKPRSATITATTDLVCHGLTFWEFRPLVEANATIAWALLQYMAGLLRAAQEDSA